MEYFSRSDVSPRMAIFLTMVLAAVGFVLFLVFGVATVALVLGIEDINMILSNNLGSEKGIMAIRVMQIFQTIGIFIFPSLVLAYFVSKQPFDLLGFRKVDFGILGLSVLFMVIAMPGINLIASLNAEIPMPSWMLDMERTAERLIKAMLVTDRFSIFSINLLMVAVLPAIGEELFFRGILQRYFIKMTKSEFLGVLVTSLVFSAIHLQFQGFIPRFLLGMIFGYLYVWSRTIWVPIVVHFVNNGIAAFAYFLIGRKVISIDIENMGSMSDHWQVGIASIFLSLALLGAIRRQAPSAE